MCLNPSTFERINKHHSLLFAKPKMGKSAKRQWKTKRREKNCMCVYVCLQVIELIHILSYWHSIRGRIYRGVSREYVGIRPKRTLMESEWETFNGSSCLWLAELMDVIVAFVFLMHGGAFSFFPFSICFLRSYSEWIMNVSGKWKKNHNKNRI